MLFFCAFFCFKRIWISFSLLNLWMERTHTQRPFFSLNNFEVFKKQISNWIDKFPAVVHVSYRPFRILKGNSLKRKKGGRMDRCVEDLPSFRVCVCVCCWKRVFNQGSVDPHHALVKRNDRVQPSALLRARTLNACNQHTHEKKKREIFLFFSIEFQRLWANQWRWESESGRATTFQEFFPDFCVSWWKWFVPFYNFEFFFSRPIMDKRLTDSRDWK